MTDKKPLLVITRGIPASGKTTYARNWVAQDPAHNVRLNRDDLRAMTHDAAVLDYDGETAITLIQQASARELLRAGRNVIVDDTNLRMRYARAWADVAGQAGADFGVVDFPTPLGECIARDAARAAAGARSVGEDVIRGMYARFIAGGVGFAPVLPSEPKRTGGAPGGEANDLAPYVPDLALPTAWIFDVDGTLALRDAGPGGRGPFDWVRVGEDRPNGPVITLAQTLGIEDDIVVMSGRKECCQPETQRWLENAGVTHTALFMRADNDDRPDWIVKRELFTTRVAPRWRVLGVFDDRDSVVEKTWRAMGLLCGQVARGDF